MKCDYDCFSCPYPDCINDSLRYEDYKEIDEIEKTIKAERAGIKGKKVAAQQKAWYEANRDRVAAQKKAWYEANRDRVAAQKKAYRERKKQGGNDRGQPGARP